MLMNARHVHLYMKYDIVFCATTQERVICQQATCIIQVACVLHYQLVRHSTR